jgi:hypothetical protein
LPQPCPHCDQPDMSLLRLVLIGEILRADETLLVLLADIMQTCGLLPLAAAAAEPAATRVRLQKGTLHMLRRLGSHDQGRGEGSARRHKSRSRPPHSRGVHKQQ